MADKTLMKMKELMERSGLPRTTIHFYLREGLLHPPIKTGRTMAYYDQSHLERLQAIKKIKKDLRVPVELIREELEQRDMAPDKPMPSATEFSHQEKSLDEHKQTRRYEIMQAAIKVFSEKGYHRTKVQDITQAMGMSTGTFYIYFPNKRELFVEVVDEVFRTIVGDAAVALRAEEDPVERLKIRGEVFYRNYTKYNEILHQLRAEVAGEDEWPHNRIKQAYKELTKPVIREVKDCIRLGLLRELDPDLVAYALTGIIEIMSFRVSLDDKYTFKDVQDFIADFAELGLRSETREQGSKQRI